MNKFCRCWIAVSLLLLSTGASAQDAVVGKLGATEVKMSDLKKILEGQTPETKTALLASLPELERLVRSELIRTNLLIEAKSKGFDKKPEVLQQIERAKDQALLEAYANSIARPPAEYPSDGEVKTYYDSNTSSFVVPTQYRVAQIYLAIPEGADKIKIDSIAKQAQDLSTQAQKATTDFAALARENSAHKESAQKGGEMGWLPESQLIPEIKTVLSQLTLGKTSGPIKTSQGFHLMKLLEKKESAVRPLSDVKSSIVSALRYRKAQENERKYLEDVATKSPIAVNQIELTKAQSSLR
jgi:parvulin-like peptidyl-prolyl isomerase